MGDDQQVAEEKFKEIQAAYEVLSNPHKREWYVIRNLIFNQEYTCQKSSH